MKKNILVFTGAGVSVESGIETFRTDDNGLWYNYNVEDVATLDGWLRDNEKVLNFYNERRRLLKDTQPNLAHKLIADLEKDYNVVVVTQNVDDLHERGGSTKVIHLHGELTKSKSSEHRFIYNQKEDIKIGDKCDKGSQLRPYIVFFGEDLDSELLEESKKVAIEADICIVIGTSMLVHPACSIPFQTKEETPIYYIDPGDYDFGLPTFRKPFFKHHKETASIGLKKVIDDLK